MNAARQVLRRFVLFTAVSLTALAVLVSAPALAQEDESEPDESEGIEDIYVTAERRETRLQETPVAISVFSGADLNEQGYLDFEDVSFSVPNVQYGRTLVGSGGVTIRGISSSVGDRSTAFHFDGIYIDRGGAVEGLTFFDIKQVEVLRGPQGTLYGRNATGGAINVISNPPVADFEAFGDIQFGAYNQVLWRGALNVPIVADKLFARVSLLGEKHDGYQKNITEKQTITWDGSPVKRDDADDRDQFGVRTQLRWLPTDDIDLTLRYNYGQEKGVGPAQKILGKFASSVAFPGPGGLILNIDQYCRSAGAQAAGCMVTDNPTNNRRIALNLIGDVDAWEHNVNGQLNWDLPELDFVGETQFQARFSYLRRRSYGLTDQDGSDGDLVRLFDTRNTTYQRVANPTPPPDTNLEVVSGCEADKCALGETEAEAGGRPGHNKLTETTVELQWANTGGGDLDWVLGAFYLNTKSNVNFIATTKPAPWIISGLPPGIPGDQFASLPVPVLETTTNRAKSLAAFGQASYQFGRDTESIWDNFTPTFGLRYSYDWKKGIRKTPAVEAPLEIFPGSPPIIVPVQAQIDESDSERWGSPKDALTGTARIEWDPTDENHLYLSGSRGYKSGVIVTALEDPNDPSTSFPNAGPEHIWALELGSKNEFWDDRIRANLTGFYYWYEDLQVSQLAGASIITQNAADATVWGFEAELTLRPLVDFVPEFFEGLTLIGNFGYLHAEYDSFKNCYLGEANSSIDCSGNTLTRAPPYTATVIADWPFDFGRWGTVTPNVQLYASGKVYFRPSNCPNAECEAALAGTGRQQNKDFQSPYEIWDARLSWTSADQHVNVAAFVNNIADKDVIQSQVVGSFLIGAPIQVRFDRPRTWGIRVGLAW